MREPSTLDPDAARRALRRLHGEPMAEGTPARDDGSQAAERLEALWRALEPPAAAEPPADFAARTAEALRLRNTGGAWWTAPTWARAGAAAALAAGLVLGLALGRQAPPRGSLAGEVRTDELWTGDLRSDGLTDEAWSEAWTEAYESSFGDGTPAGDS